MSKSVTWPSITLGFGPLQIIDGDRGKNYPSQQDFASTGYCLFLNAGNVTKDGFSFSDVSFINADKDNALGKGKLRRNDVILTTRGTVGNSAYFDKTIPFNDVRINSGMVILRADPSILDPYFLYLFVRSANFNKQVTSLITGSAQPQLPIRDMNRIGLSLPSLPEQRAIASILGALDDKIELNRKMSATLEAMARAIFKSWFVDFDPVRAKAEGRDTGLTPEIAGLFANSFSMENGLQIPEGWHRVPISDLCEIVGGSTPSTTDQRFWNGKNSWATPKDLSDLSFPVLLSTQRMITDEGLKAISSGLLPSGTVLLSSRAPIGYLAITEIPVAINQGFIALKPRPVASNLFLLRWIKSAMQDIIDRANGSTFLEISKSNFRGIHLTCPTSDVMKIFDEVAKPLYERMVIAQRESVALAALRDTLLPKLISGDLRVSEVERILEMSA